MLGSFRVCTPRSRNGVVQCNRHHTGTHTTLTEVRTQPAQVIYLPALPPLASARTVFHSMSPLSSAWMEVWMLRAFFRFSRVLA